MEAYKASLRRWMTTIALVGTIAMAASLWLGVYYGVVEVIFMGAFAAFWTVCATFVIVTAYYLVLGYLASKERPPQT